MTRLNRRSLLPLPDSTWYIIDLSTQPGHVVTCMSGPPDTTKVRVEAIAEKLTQATGDTHVVCRAITVLEME